MELDMTMTSLKEITSGVLAHLAGVNRETIRFYERRGLLPKPRRNPSKYRIYNETDVQRVRFITQAKNLGFTLSEIDNLLSIADGRIVSCAKVRVIAERRLLFIDEQIRNLTLLQEALRQVVTKCSNAKTISACPLIYTLTTGGR